MKTLRQIKEKLEIPAIGQTLSRDLMPQIDSAFLKYLKTKGISYTKEQLNTADLKSTQSEFDDMKILSLMSNNDTDPIFVSNDNYVLDGHHRWIADHNTDGKTEAYVIDLPILELLRVAKEYESMLKEEVTHKDFGPMMDAFVSFASDKLGIKSLPKINYKNDDEQGEQPSFGGYNPSSNEIIICTKNRHPMDVFRTLAHELVHHKQNEDGRIKDVSKEGSTGSPIEDEANSMAGRLMRWFGKANPDKFALSHIVEENLNTEESLHKWFQSKSSDGKRGWVQIGGKYHGKPCARQPGQTSTPKCRSSDEASRMTKDEIKYAVEKKRREDKNQPKKTNAAKPTRVATYKEKKMNEEKDIKGKNSGKKDACYHKVKARYDVWPSAYASGALVKCRNVGADNWGKKSVDEEFSEITESKKDSSKVVLGKTLTAGQKMAAAERAASKGKKGIKRKDIASKYAMMDPMELVKAQLTKHQPKEKTKREIVPVSQKTVGSSSKEPARHTQIPPETKRMPAAPRPIGSTGYVEKKILRSFDDHVKHFEETGEWNHNAAVNALHNVYEPLIANAPESLTRKGLKNNLKIDLEKAKRIKRLSKGKSPESIGTRILKALRLKEENTPAQRELGTESLARTYAEDTPGQKYPPPPMFPMNPLFEKKMKFVRKKEIEEGMGTSISSNSELNVPYTLPATDGIGPETGNRYASNIYGMSGTGSSLGIGYSPFGIPVAESTQTKTLKQIREAFDKGVGLLGTVENSGSNETVYEERPGLWANIRKRRAGGKRMRRKGEKGAPTEAQLRSAKGLDENVDKASMACNKPRAQAHGSGETGKSHIVKACAGGKEKIIRFGQLGVKGSPKKEGESEAYRNRRKRFKARHSKNIAKGKMSAAYWANKVKW